MLLLVCNILTEEERAGYFSFLDLLLSCGYLCFMSIPCGAMNGSAVSDWVFSGQIHLLYD